MLPMLLCAVHATGKRTTFQLQPDHAPPPVPDFTHGADDGALLAALRRFASECRCMLGAWCIQCVGACCVHGAYSVCRLCHANAALCRHGRRCWLISNTLVHAHVSARQTRASACWACCYMQAQSLWRKPRLRGHRVKYTLTWGATTTIIRLVSSTALAAAPCHVTNTGAGCATPVLLHAPLPVPSAPPSLLPTCSCAHVQTQTYPTPHTPHPTSHKTTL